MPADKRAALRAPSSLRWRSISTRCSTSRPRSRHAKIALPTLLLQGGCTTLPSRCVCKRLRDALPAALFRVVQGAGHMLPLTHRDAVNALIAEHLEANAVERREAA